MRTSRVTPFVFGFLLAATIWLIAPALSRGQGAPWYTIPLPFPGGFVDAATGNVHLEMRLGPPPEPTRSGDLMGSKLGWDWTLHAYNGNISMFTPATGWYGLSASSHSGDATISNSSQPCPSGYPNGSVNIASNPSFTDNHGTHHQLVNQNLYTKQVNCSTTSGVPYGNGGDITSFSGIASDGSGYRFQVTNYTQMQVFSPDGWLVYNNATGSPYPMDPNGNYGSQPNTSVSSTAGLCPTYPQTVPPTYTSTTSYTTSGGSSVSYTINCTALSVSEILGGTQYTGTVNFLTSIVLEDQTQYTFTYDTGTTGNHPGGLQSITLPTGGTVSFTFVSGWPSVLFGGLPASVTFGGGTWNLSYAYNYSTGVTTTTVLSPSRYDSGSNSNVTDKTVFTSVPFNPYLQTAQYYSGSSNLLRTVSTTYDPNGNFLPSTIATTLNDSGQSSSISYLYFNNMRNYPTQKQETDFSGAVVRTTVTAYNPSFMKPTSVNVYAGSNTSGTPVSSTLYTYDEYNANYCKNSVPMLTNFTGAYGHDDANHGTSWIARGNVTTIQRLVSGTTYTTTHNCYDTLGNVTQTVDANGNPTSYDYSENWADSYCIPSGTITHAFHTTVTDALGHQSKTSYYSCGILKHSVQDPNDLAANRSGTVYTYDELNRPLTTTFPDGGSTTIGYPSPTLVTTTRAMGSAGNMQTAAVLDGYGRTIQTQLNSDQQDCPSGDKTDTTYDGFGRVYTVSNPYCSTSNGTASYTYDALGRTTVIKQPDGWTALRNYHGNLTEVSDEGNGTQRVQRMSQTDALGRTTSVCEVASAPFIGAGGASSNSLIGSAGTPVSCASGVNATGFVTTYQYDALDNLLQVNQSGIGPRTFTYDSVSRLACASNPETSSASCPATASGTYTPGTTGYTYDANGNLSTRIAPAPNQTGSATVTTNYQYDPLNRVTQKSYSDGLTPTATFTYDTSTINGQNYPGNPIGRLVATATTSCTETIYEHDPMGRITYELQMTPLSCNPGRQNWQPYQINYTYDLMGNMTSRGDGYFHTYTHTFNSAGRLTGVTSSYNDGGVHFPGTLVSGMHYDAAGHITSDTLGDGETESFTYDKRGRQQSATAMLNTTQIYSYNVSSFAPNGDVLSAQDSANGNWTYGYDSFNRLTCANLASNGTCSAPTSGTPTYTYVYDRFGNRWQQNGPHSMIQSFTGNNPTSPANNNRVDGLSYDAAGNVLNDGVHSYTYDAENRLITVDGGNTASYIYNAEGNRVRRTGVLNDTCDSTGIRDYVYDLSNRWVLEVNYGGTACNYEIYAGSRHLGSYRGDTLFSHTDWLGTERASENYYYRNLDPPNTCASLPFGDALTCSNLGTYASTLHFTGKERDYESGLDNFGARYDSSSMGRFMSPDPLAGHTEDPQTLNRYTYVRNNPLSLTDPTGLDFYLQCQNSDHSGCTQVQTDPNNDKSQQWVQADQNGNATIITSDSIRAGDNTATVSENGVTINRNSQGIYFDNPASHTTDANGNDVNNNPINLAGSGALKDFSFTINGNCSGTCLSSGAWQYSGSLNAARALLDDRGSFRVLGPLEDIRAAFGFGAHPYSTQHRFGGAACSFWGCANSPHLSVPYDPNGTLEPRNNVPATGGFHVDAHGDAFHHAQDVSSNPQP